MFYCFVTIKLIVASLIDKAFVTAFELPQPPDFENCRVLNLIALTIVTLFYFLFDGVSSFGEIGGLN